MAQVSPEEMFKFYKGRIIDVLNKHNPSGLKTVDPLLKQFPGKEYQVYKQICKMWKVDPQPPATPSEILAKPSQAEVNSNQGGEVSRWLRNRGFTSYSKLPQFQSMTLRDFMAIDTKKKLMDIGVIPKHAEILWNEILQGAYQKSQKVPKAEKPAHIADFKVGEPCFTKVMLVNSKGEEKWLNATVTNVNDDNTFDISVNNAANYGVPPDAVNVPRKMLKKLTENVEIAVPDPKRKASKRPQFQQGDRVQVSGLRSHESYNGLCGTILLYVPSQRRYQVRLDTNDIIAVKQRNVGAVVKGADKANHLPLNAGMKIIKKVNNEHADDAVLSSLMVTLMQDNPNTDAGKLGEFAAAYLLSKKKHKKLEGPLNIGDRLCI